MHNNFPNAQQGNFNSAPQPTLPPRLPTRCPYSFKILPDQSMGYSPFAKDAQGQPQELPEGWAHSGTITFAMAGARSSGKSLYIAVVVKQLRELVVANGGTFRAANDYTEQTYREKYEEPLFENMGLLPPTPPSANPDAHQREPLIFDIGYYARGAEGQMQKIFVVFRDVAGEDLKQEGFGQRVPQLEFFRHAQSIIFLYDPMAVPRIRDLLAGTVSANEVAADNPTDILKNVLRVLGEDHRPAIALTLSKFDTMQHLEKVDQLSGVSAIDGGVNWQRVMRNKGAAFCREGSAFQDVYDMDDGSLLHQEVLSMLRSLQAVEMINTLNQPMFGRRAYIYKCFAVSALGEPPTSDQVSSSGIAPFRCLDPIRILLHTYKIFPNTH
ncbi:TRAFAC clade GTPase domain-containing protein [Corynebacterium suicordis]|uniref:Double-GTPase 2 domain-containing protein n=1 Tax=Corynebacterium suicordis DSM 45110 TaxID=1121369 RepID=A0ABR9ZI05_9CORY|nr:hypothetical protein [Corynebacterium suicordis]MBF4552854.1 hypothetical protein [Corynebacterium suicordis DSM 45110]MDR6278188.1 hypothetical protein [Corynebacterium suicordis]